MEANNPEKEIDLVELGKTIWAQRKRIIQWGCMGLAAGVIIAFSIPKEYTSTIIVAPEGQSSGASASMGALAGMMGMGGLSTQQDGLTAAIYPEILASSPFLLEFADIPVIYQEEQMPFSNFLLKERKEAWWKVAISLPAKTVGWVLNLGKEKVDTFTVHNSPGMQQGFCGLMKQSIKLESDKKSGTLVVTSTFQDADIAKLVSDSVLSKLQTYVVNYKTAKTRQNLEVNLKVLEQTKERYYAADEEFAQAQDKNLNLTTRSANMKLDRLRNERDLAFQIYQQLATQVESDRIKLQEERPIATVIEPASTPIRPSAPNKMMIMVALAFLGGFAATGMVLVKELLKG